MKPAGRNSEALAPNSVSVDWEWVYGEMVDPGVEHPPVVTSISDGDDPDLALSDSGAA